MSQPDQSTVVVIDDEQPIVDLVCDILTDELPVRTVPCPFGHKAYPCIQQFQPQLVILDVQMPGVDGIQVFQQMRAEPTTRSIPVIFITAVAHNLERWLPDYQGQGAQLLRKPFDIPTLIDVVSHTLAA